MADLPPLPEPGTQRAEDRRTIGRRFLYQAAQHLLDGDRLQAGEKAWGAVAQNLKVIGELRGWHHGNHQQIRNIGSQIVLEFGDIELSELLSEVYHNGHQNFYENQRTIDETRETIRAAEQALHALEALQQMEPRPSTISSNTQLRRLRALTGNNDLQIGDSSPVGFSLKHTAGESGFGASDNGISE